MKTPRSQRARRRKRQAKKERQREAARQLFRESEEAIRRMRALERAEQRPRLDFRAAGSGAIRLLPGPIPPMVFPHFDYASLERRILAQLQGRKIRP